MPAALRAAWGFTGIFLLALLWMAAHALYGPFVMPRLDETLAAVVEVVRSGVAARAAITTAGQAICGWLIGCGAGLALALVAGAWPPLAAALAPIATLLIGTPPVAWMVLALLWFGPGGGIGIFTVSLTVAPMIFGAALHGILSRDPALDEMARQFRAPWRQRITDIVAPQMRTALTPAVASALGFSWKVGVMTEVMASGTGIGGELALARAHLDLPQTMAWILILLALVLISDGVLVLPLRTSREQ